MSRLLRLNLHSYSLLRPARHTPPRSARGRSNGAPPRVFHRNSTCRGIQKFVKFLTQRHLPTKAEYFTGPCTQVKQRLQTKSGTNGTNGTPVHFGPFCGKNAHK